jgi:chromosome segregation ATPase
MRVSMFFWSREKIKKTEVEEWIRKKYSAHTEKILHACGKYMDDLEKTKDEIKRLLEELRMMEPDKRIFRKIYKIALSCQDKFVNSLLLTIEKIDMDYDDIDSLKETHEHLLESIGSMEKYIGMHGKYLMMVYEKEMKRLNSLLRDFADSVESLGETLEDPDLIKIRKFKSMLNKNEEREREIDENRSKIEENKRKIKKIEKDIENKREELSHDKDKIRKEKEKIDEYEGLKNEFKKVGNEIYGKIAPLKREMRKLERMLGDRKLKDQIQNYRDSPVRTFLHDDDLGVFRELLSSIEEIEKNEHKREKTTGLLKYILEGNLEEKKKEYVTYKNEIDSFVVTHKAQEKKKKIERKTESLQKKLARYEETIKDFKEKNESLHHEIRASKEKLLEKLEEEFNVKVQE